MNIDGLRSGGPSPCLTVARELSARFDRPVAVIEIGTSYGENLPTSLSGANVGRLCCVDPMYDWVPDVPPDVPFEQDRVDGAKVARWNANAVCCWPLHPTLMIGRSWDVAMDPERRELLSGTDVLVVDGCHHPASAVEADYWAYEPLLNDEHLVVFDDLQIVDVDEAYKRVRDALSSSGSLLDHKVVSTVGVLHVRRCASR